MIHSLVAFFPVSHKLPEFMFDFMQCIAWKSNRVLAMHGDKSRLHPSLEKRPQCVRQDVEVQKLSKHKLGINKWKMFMS